MKALIINGSPRGGASGTLRIARAFASGFGGEVELREITLAKMDIRPCRGCFCCWTTSPGRCVVPDDMEEIYPLLEESDVIIESFPLYFFGMPSVMKAMTDRTLPLAEPYRPREGRSFHRIRAPRLLSHRLVVISSCGFVSAPEMYASLDRQLEGICGGVLPTRIYCSQGELLTQLGERRQTRAYLELAHRAGSEFFTGGEITAQTAAALSRPILSEKAFSALTGHRWYNEEVKTSENEENLYV